MNPNSKCRVYYEVFILNTVCLRLLEWQQTKLKSVIYIWHVITEYRLAMMLSNQIILETFEQRKKKRISQKHHDKNQLLGSVFEKIMSNYERLTLKTNLYNRDLCTHSADSEKKKTLSHTIIIRSILYIYIYIHVYQKESFINVDYSQK